MTNSVRSLGILDGRRDSALRWAALALLLAAIGFLFLAPPAGALVIAAEGGTKVGILPSNNELLLDGSAAFDRVNNFHFFAGPESFGNPSGNPVVHGANIYAIYWDPTKGDYHGDWERVVDGFLRDVGSSSNQFNSVFSVDTQYTDKTNEPAYDAFSFHGAITDTQPYPTTGNCTDPEPILEWPRSQTKSLGCLTDKQVREQLSSFIAQHGLPTGMHTIYYLLTPPGLTVCLDEGGPGGHCSDFESSKFERSAQTFTTESYEHSFCSYHGAINPDKAESGDGNTLLYGMIPWTAGGLGDGDLALENETYATYCQDGGFNPVSKPRIETWSEEPPKANDQEPNQDTQCPSEDGFCDVGLADLIINQIGVQQQDTVTNPLLNAWQDKFGNEVADECRNFFAPAEGSFTPNPETSAGTLYDQQLGAGRYFINTSFNEASMKLQFPGISCLPGIRLEPHFTAPNVVNAGEIVAFNGQESDITLNANTTFTAGGAPQNNYATYSWNFGDGSPTVSGYAPGTPPCETPWLSPCAASPSHAYQYGGTYEVTLTVKDVGGETEQVVHDVTVVGPPPPGSGGSGGSSSGSGGSGGAASSGGTTGSGGSGSGKPGSPSGAAQLTPPVATEAVLTRSLRSALKGGLLVSYSVDQQVAGHFEVLLAQSVAKHLRISAPLATNLPVGAAPEVIIGQALLVTTRGGRDKAKIYFSKRIAARLAHAHKVELMLRVIVRNRASRTPTTVISAFTLVH